MIIYILYIYIIIYNTISYICKLHASFNLFFIFSLSISITIFFYSSMSLNIAYCYRNI